MRGRSGGTEFFHWPRTGLVARCGGRIVGTVQLNLAMPPNQKHRADVMKLLVHPDFRGRGIAEPLYLSIGYLLAGIIPEYARAPASPVLEATSLLYKKLV